MPPFHRPFRIEQEYRRALDALMRSWMKLPTGIDLDAIFTFLQNGGGERVMQASDRLARSMVTATAVQNAQSWREAATKSTQGKRIFELLKREMDGPVGAQLRLLVEHHAKLIRSIPQDLAQDVASQIATRQMRGERAETIAKDIRTRLPEITKSRIAMLARTQVSVASESITRARAEHLGANWYEWLSSEDSRVRPSHRKMDRVICRWDDPPSPESLVGEKFIGRYNAGNIFNCRCTGVPILDLDEVHWPAKVYQSGSIKRMTRANFLKIAA
jgi:SPP1 gp7 family putative phage head morphogenesis protein